jgi:hypothetical protein
MTSWFLAKTFDIPPSDSVCIKRMFPRSPALDTVGCHQTSFDEASIWNPNTDFLGPHRPSIKVEEAWVSLFPSTGIFLRSIPIIKNCIF